MIAIIDYEAGNLTSVQRALRFLGQESIITGDFSTVMNAERIIFPGVGAAGKAMSDLKRLKLDQAILESYYDGKPVLGICLGTQIVMEWSQENNTRCLGLIKGEVRRFPENLGANASATSISASNAHVKSPRSIGVYAESTGLPL